MNKRSEEVQVLAPLGLHARPASSLVRLLQGTRSSVKFSHGGRTANGRSIMELLMLAAKRDAKVLIEVIGDDADEVMDRLVGAFKRGFEVAE